MGNMTDENCTPEGDNATADADSLLDAAYSFLNIGLLESAVKDLQKIDTYVMSVTAFHIGVVTLAIWSLIMFLSYFIGQISSSQGLLGILSTAVQLGPVLPFFLFVFAYISSWSFNRLEENSPPDSKWSIFARRVGLGAASVMSLVTAGVGRWAMIQAVDQVFGNSVNVTQVVAIILIEIGYLALLLIGLGGIASLIYEPNIDAEVDDS